MLNKGSYKHRTKYSQILFVRTYITIMQNNNISNLTVCFFNYSNLKISSCSFQNMFIRLPH